MGWRKFKADQIFNGSELLPSGTVLITDETGLIVELVAHQDAGDEIESFNGLLTPGFVNTHCHLELSHMKGIIPSGTGLVEFLTRVIKERNFLTADIQGAIERAEKEMYSSGIAAVGDICNTTDTIRIKKTSEIHWRNFIEVIGFTEAKAQERLDYAKKVLHEFKNQDSLPGHRLNPSANQQAQLNLQRSSLTPHAPYSVSKSLFLLISENAGGEPVSIHNQESVAENEFYKTKTGEMFDLYKNLNIDPSLFLASGKTSLRTYLPWLGKREGVILVHNTYTEEEDILFANSSSINGQTFFCICINANRYIEFANPPLAHLRKHNCLITIGTDSYASNRQLNILSEIKTIQQQFPEVPLSEILQWSTINGAKALKLDEHLGSFLPGKRPGVVLISNLHDQTISPHSTAQRII